ncbi:hypothetical protein Hanom_Chr10g00916721 [Helianthus anomalus]
MGSQPVEKESNEGVNGTLNGEDYVAMNEDQPSPMIENRVQDGDNFTPAANFPFDQLLETNNKTGSRRAIKRKKLKKLKGLGQSSRSFSSSLENLKKGKKPKVSKKDLFGLNKLLGLVDESDQTGDSTSVNFGAVNSDDIDLNSVPSMRVPNLGSQSHSISGEMNDGPAETVEGIEDVEPEFQVQHNDNLFIPDERKEEVEATKELGGKLGVCLDRYDGLISKSITKEGLQIGKS